MSQLIGYYEPSYKNEYTGISVEFGMPSLATISYTVFYSYMRKKDISLT